MKHEKPLPGSSEIQVSGKISTSLLIRLWESRYGMDVRRFFSSPETRLEPVAPYGYFRFSSVASGDDKFYALLMRRLGYDLAEKSEFIEAAREIDSQDRVLDVGSGIGNFATRCVGSYRGLETNPAAVEDAGKLGRNVHFGSIDDEPKNSCDVVTIFQVLEHVDDPKAFLHACVKCLRTGGKLIVSTPDMEGIMGYVANEILNYPPHHMSWWSETSLCALIKDCGCEIKEVWHEPLRRGHLRTALSALFWPRDEKHLTSSTFFPIVEFLTKILARIAPKGWDEIPFIKGHTIMVVAKKTA